MQSIQKRYSFDLHAIVFYWTALALLPWIKYPAVGPPYHLAAFLLYVAVLLAFIFPIILSGTQRIDIISDALPRMRKDIFYAATILSFLSIISFVQSYSAMASMDLYTAKYLYSTQQIDPNKIFARMSLLCAPAIPIFIFECARSITALQSKILLVLFLCFVGISIGSRFGARFDLLVFIGFSFYSLCLTQSSYIYKYFKHIVLVIILFLILAFSINTRFSFYRNSQDETLQESQSLISEGELFFEALGWTDPPPALSYAFAALDDYFLSLLDRLGIYLEENEEAPGFGQVSFYIFFQQLGLDEGQSIKLSVDELYRSDVTGRVQNYWATGIRDFCMDWGVIGTIIAAGILSFLYCMGKRLWRRSYFAGVLCSAAGTSVFLLSTISVFKSTYIQIALPGIIVLLAIDLITHSMLTRFLFPKPRISLESGSRH